MAMQTLPADVRPAKIAHTSSSMSESTALAVEMARLHLRTGNPGAYARALAGVHRASTTRQQDSIEAVIAADGCERLFTTHAVNGCLMAREG
ncbi:MULTISPECIES: hypothetical protein [unclassified Sphingomonas]|uniref:hypothetical protein n=1 Tax=unclassified Sphingomonas TaxID=196159 RepID=UPI00226A9F8E|nr:MULTISPECIES: hypothetical protein [unclassified Sphingomonas]